MKTYELFFVLAFSIAFVCAVLSCQRYKGEATAAKAEAARAVEATKKQTQAISRAAEIEARASEHIEHETQILEKKAAEIRGDCASIDAELDGRLRELAIEAYRAAVLCGEASR